MARRQIAGILFGGATVSAFVGYGGVNGSVVISRRAVCDYGGLVGSEFVEPTELQSVVGSVLSEVTGEKQAVGSLVLGVPPQFCKVIVRESVLEFPKPTKVTVREIAKLFNEVEVDQIEGYSITSKSAVYFKVDDGNAIIDAKGRMAVKLSAQISIMLVSDNFVQIAVGCLDKKWLPVLSFIPTVLAQANYFIDEDARDNTCVLVSCGMFATALAVSSGDSLVYLKTLELGLGHFVNDVASVLGVSFYTAKLLVDEAVLSVTMGQNDNYQINIGETTQKFAAAKVNDIIKSRLAFMAQHIKSTLKKALGEGIMQKEFYICGGHLDAIAGARDLLSKSLKLRIRQAICPFTGLARAEYTERAIIKQATR